MPEKKQDRQFGTQIVWIDPARVGDIHIPDNFDDTAATSTVDKRVLSLARLLGKQAAKHFLTLEAANDNEPPQVRPNIAQE